jgi:iron complex outermembrane receptor protein
VTSITDYQNLAKYYTESDDGAPSLPYVEGRRSPLHDRFAAMPRR